MQDKKSIYIISIGSLILALMCLLVAFLYKGSAITTQPVFSSVTQGQEYFSTTTQNNTNSPVQNLQNFAVITTGPGSLAQVTITGANTGNFTLYDATSTVTNSSWGTTTLATFPASTAAGTYTFDMQFQKGLLFQFNGLLATATIMYRK